MQGNKAQPTVPTGPTIDHPAPPYEVADMAHFHRLATSGKLSDLLFKIGRGNKAK